LFDPSNDDERFDNFDRVLNEYSMALNYDRVKKTTTCTMLQTKDVCLMDIAVMGMRELKKRGLLNDLDESDEVNACSIVVNVDVNGKMKSGL